MNSESKYKTQKHKEHLVVALTCYKPCMVLKNTTSACSQSLLGCIF